METSTYKTAVVVHEWRTDLANEGYSKLHEHFYDCHREYTFINVDEQELRYIYVNFRAGHAWMEDSHHHRIREFQYTPRRAAAPLEQKISFAENKQCAV